MTRINLKQKHQRSQTFLESVFKERGKEKKEHEKEQKKTPKP